VEEKGRRTMNKTVSEQALIKRINRRIGGYDAKRCIAWGERLRKNNSDRWWSDLGGYYTVDWNSNAVTSAHVNLEQYGREVGALTGREALEN
jgi:hypothetical protein